MSAFYYDLHMHSCLSPCADADMTPGNIVGMAKLKGLDVIALTDHNTCGNCEAAVKIGERLGILVLPGMELCTAEDIHVVCLFEKLAGALEFSKYVYSRLPDIKNRPDIYGEQTLTDELDAVRGSEPRLLLNAAELGVNQVTKVAERFGGCVYPAHVDRPANGIMGILGSIPPEASFTSAELSPVCDQNSFLIDNPEIASYRIFRDSDAHYLWQISERENCIVLPELTARGLIELVKRKKDL
jgi:PHP family Zn ribbon phosphoesterase